MSALVRIIVAMVAWAALLLPPAYLLTARAQEVQEFPQDAIILDIIYLKCDAQSLRWAFDKAKHPALGVQLSRMRFRANQFGITYSQFVDAVQQFLMQKHEEDLAIRAVRFGKCGEAT